MAHPGDNLPLPPPPKRLIPTHRADGNVRMTIFLHRTTPRAEPQAGHPHVSDLARPRARVYAGALPFTRR
jgi:hypothetical protein